jgi:hypothetical protein
VTEIVTPAEQAMNELVERQAELQSEHEAFMETVAAGRIGDLYLLQQLPPLRGLSDVARVMREGRKPKPMLLDHWIAAAELHWMHAEPGEGKTWFGLWIAKQVMDAGDVVVWCDEEMGIDTAAERLLALGADPDVVESRFAYFAYPGWLSAQGDLEAWETFIKLARPGLVVMDTATDALAEAGLNENDGREVTAWVKTFCEPPRRVGAAVLVLDHVPKSGESRGYAVGSRAKKAKAKVMYELRTQQKFDRYKVGLVQVKVVKNGIGADIDTIRAFRVGGQVDEADVESFVIEPASELETAVAQGDRQSRFMQLQRDMVEAIRNATGPLTKGQIKSLVSGNATNKVKALDAIAASPEFWNVKVTPKGNSLVFEALGDEQPAKPKPKPQPKPKPKPKRTPKATSRT